MDVEALERKLRDIYASRSDKTLYILGAASLKYQKIIDVIDAASLKYQKIIDVIDAAKGAGVGRVGIITEGMRAGR